MVAAWEDGNRERGTERERDRATGERVRGAEKEDKKGRGRGANK